MEISLGDIFTSDTILMDIASTTKEDVFSELADAIKAVHPESDKKVILAALWEREKKLSTGITSGVAIPHAICSGIGTTAGALGISRAGIEYDALDKKPVHVIFMLVMGDGTRENHPRILERIFSLVRTEALALIKNAENAQNVHAVLSRFSLKP